MEWLSQALCKKKHSDLWFPPFELSDGTPVPRSAHSQYYDVSRLVCDVCPVRQRCEALGAEEEFGLWGGTTPNDRKRGVGRTVPSKQLTPAQILTMIPKQGPITLDIKPLRTQILSVAKRKPRKT